MHVGAHCYLPPVVGPPVERAGQRGSDVGQVRQRGGENESLNHGRRSLIVRLVDRAETREECARPEEHANVVIIDGGSARHVPAVVGIDD